MTHGREKSERIDIITEKKSEKQIRIPEGMTLSAGLTHYRFILKSCFSVCFVVKKTGSSRFLKAVWYKECRTERQAVFSESFQCPGLSVLDSSGLQGNSIDFNSVHFRLSPLF